MIKNKVYICVKLLRMFLNKVHIVVLLLSSSVNVLSQSTDFNTINDTIEDLEEVIVTGTRTKRQLSSLPLPATVISKEQIKASGTVRLDDILFEQTGITFFQDRTLEGIQMQGVDGDYILILVDGLPLVGRITGTLDLSRVSVQNIEQIEIVKGPSSSLYGSEALGGVINIITRKPKRNTYKGNVQYFSRFGGQEELDLTTSHSYGSKRFFFQGDINSNSGGAYDLSPDTPESITGYGYQNLTGNAAFKYELSDQFKVTFTQRYYQQEVYNEEQNNPEQRDINSTIKIDHDINDDWRFEYVLYRTGYKTESTSNTVLNLYDEVLIRPEIKTQVKLGTSEIVAGIGGQLNSLDRTYFSKNEQYNSYYAFGQYDINPLEDLNVILGCRYDGFNKFKSAFSPKLSARYALSDDLAVKGSIGYGYKVPDFSDLFYNFRNVTNGYVALGTYTIDEIIGVENLLLEMDPELLPESSIGYNFGLQFKTDFGLKIDINLFRNNIKNLIDSFLVQLKGEGDDDPNNNLVISDFDSSIPDGTRIYSYQNRDRVYTQGIEVDTHYNINDNFKLSLGYQFLDTADEDQISVLKEGNIYYRSKEGNDINLKESDYFGLPNRSRHTANAKLFYKNKQHHFSANIRAIYRSKYAFTDTNNTGYGIIDVYDDFVAGFTRVNCAFDKAIHDKVTVQLGVDNLLNVTGENNRKLSPIYANNDTVLQVSRTFFGRVEIEI